MEEACACGSADHLTARLLRVGPCPGRRPAIIKTPAIDQRGDAAYPERFLMEEWIARRIDSPHVAKAGPADWQCSCVYTLTEFIEG